MKSLGSQISDDFFAVEAVLKARREQEESVAGKNTPFRVEFRYSHGTKHWQYFETLAAAMTAEDARASYGPTGRAVIESPRSKQIQVRGPRGGWNRKEE